MRSKTNLIWVDLEMTGLDVTKDHILEIAVVVTNKDLEVIGEWPSLVIHQPDTVLDSMNEWCKKQHGLSGLTQEVKNSRITLDQAEETVCGFLTDYCAPGQGIVCGNSVWQDKAFIKASMPKLASFFHYKIVDVSSLKELMIRWYPKSPYSDIKKADKHRALADIHESVEILKIYRNHFFLSESIVAAQEADAP